MNVENRQVRNANRLFLIQMIFVILVSLFGGGLLMRLSQVGNLLASQLIFAFLPLVYVIFTFRKQEFGIPLGSFRLSTLLMVLLFTFLLIPVIAAVNAFSMIFVDNYVVEMQTGLEGESLLRSLFAVALVPAFLEELVYRGIFFGSYRRLGIVKGAVFCGVIFGVMHMNFNQFGYALLLGIAFCFLMEATGSILYCMAAHFFINGWSTVVSSLSGSVETAQTAVLTQEAMVNAFCVYAVIGAVTGTLAVCVLIWIAKHSRRLEYVKEHLKGERGGITPAFLAALLLGIGFMILREL